MKKNFLILILIMVVIFPFNVKAASKEGKIDTTSALANTKTKVGDYFTISFSSWFWGLEKNTYDTYGVAAVSFTIKMDDEDFIISSISSNKWDTTVYNLGDGNYQFVSEYIEGSDDANACIEKSLYCSSYTLDVNFFVKNTKKENSSIIMTSATAGFLDLSKDYEEITEDDVIISTYKNIRTVTMTIEQPTQEAEYKEPDNNIAKESSGEHSVETVTQTKNATTSNTKVDNNKSSKSENKKSSNNYLESLEIKNYPIDFKKDELNYNITIENDINQLEINAKAEDDKSSLEIIGADNLKENDYKVLIKVKAEDGQEKTYTISINLAAELDENNNVTNVDKKESSNNKTKIIITVVGVSIIVLLLIAGIIYNIINNKKIDKGLDF